MTTEIKTEITIPAETEALRAISDKVAEIFADAKWDDKSTQLYNVQLALNEICANIVRHAYAEIEGGKIGIKFWVTSDPPQIEIETRDSGIQFDPDDVSEPSLGEPQVHGYGLFLVRELMNEVSYRTENGVNIWLLKSSV